MCEMCLGRARRLVVQPGPAAAQQFRMHFPSGSVLVRVSTHCYVARVFELHAKFAWLGPANLWPGFTSRGPAWPRHSAISHVIPLRVLQTLNSYHWNCNVFGRSLKMTVGNYVRNLSGGGPANPCWPHQPAAARTAAGSCGSSGVFRSTPVGPGVLLCRLARSLPRIRYIILPARLLGGQNGTKLSLHAETAPN